MNTPISVLLCLLFTMIAGTIAYLFWMTICKVNRDTKVLKSRYILLKVVIFTFLLPIYFLFEVSQFRVDGGFSSALFKATPLLYDIACVVLAIWLVGMVVRLALLARNIWKESLSLKLYSATNEYDLVLAKVRSKVGVSARVCVLKGDYYESPCCAGLLRPRIYMPERACTEDELEHVFLHELTHHKHGDMWMLGLIQVLGVVYWFHPVFLNGRLLLQYRELMEDACDIDVCKRSSNYRNYIQVLLNMVLKASDFKKTTPSFLSEGYEDVMRRIDNMEKYKSQKPTKRLLVTILSVVVLCGSSLAVYAADSGVVAGYERIYDATWQGLEEEMNGNTENTLVEVYEKAVVDENITIEYVDEGIEAYSSYNSVNYTISSNVEKRGSAHELQAGDRVLVAVTVDPDDKNVKIGFYMSDGYVRYITGSGNIYHTFTIYDDDTYRFFVQNGNSVTVEVNGYYSIQ